jgi:hypothetical protein
VRALHRLDFNVQRRAVLDNHVAAKLVGQD